MRLTKGKENLKLPEYIKFGIELEAENVNKRRTEELVKKYNWHIYNDASLTDSGLETISPVLSENLKSSVWEEIEEICGIIKQSPNDDKREVYTDHTCGGHIHFDATIFQNNPEIIKNFLRLWAESEEFVYKMCNAKNDPIRSGAINKANITLIDVLKTLMKSPLQKEKEINNRQTLKYWIEKSREISKNIMNNIANAHNKLQIVENNVVGLTRNGMAAPIGNKILKQIENKKLKIGNPKSRIYREIFVKNRLTSERYQGLNLTNMGDNKKNTIEFRMSNGTLDPQTIKENIFLYASLISTAVEMTNNPGQMQSKLENFYKTDVTEEEKVDLFLNLIIEEPEDRQVFKERWQSVKDAPVFKTEGAKRFAQNRFRRDEFSQISETTKGTQVKSAFIYIAEIKKKLSKEEIIFEH